MKIKKILRNIVDSIASTESFLLYLAEIAVLDTFKNYIKEKPQTKNMLVLANGPSLKQSLEDIIGNKAYLDNDVITVNFMVNDDSFYVMKPKYHVISDYTLFHDLTDNEERVEDFFNNINHRVDWDLTIFIAYSLWKNKEWRSKFTNNKLKLIPFHSVEAPESTGASYLLSKMGLLGACYGSVLHHAIFVSMQMGYKVLEVYGADHTFFDGICVDEQNRVCRMITHYYDNSTEIKPIYHIYTGEKRPYKMSYFMSEYEKVFLGHDILRYIADKNCVDIINKTPISLIDSYKRK